MRYMHNLDHFVVGLDTAARQGPRFRPGNRTPKPDRKSASSDSNLLDFRIQTSEPMVFHLKDCTVPEIIFLGDLSKMAQKKTERKC